VKATKRTNMPKEFKISSPLDVSFELRRALRESSRADQLAEHAFMRTFEVYRALKFSKGQALTPEGEAALKRLDRATDALSSTRTELAEAVYQVEQVLKEAGEET
jgi:hypothetical protein